ncbi:MAG TPA: hypothetical protein VGF77_08405 [Allosphingosinicella sp.]
MSWQMVEDRLVEALQLWWRMPDSDGRYGLRGRISSIWRQFVPERALIDAVTEEPRALPPSRGDIGRMQEATDWIVHVPDRDRRMTVLALLYLARGEARVPWMELWDQLGRGRPGPDGLRMRYSRALTIIAAALNRGR